MGGRNTTTEDHSLRGPIDRSALLAIREVVTDNEPLATAELDDYLNPSTLEVTFDDGLCGADTARIDVQWTTQDDYKFHYTDSCDVNLRWGTHPHNNEYVNVRDLEHYHPPPNASSDPSEVEDSCITQSPENLVTRAVLKLWRVAYHAESLSPLNAGSNPP
ncbi:hypothetical protein G6M89_14240 [Natronolimnobius sp. AArcel1]|uniref:hypothetical protein n=1 Tax=Natronolimnobius sp. AArcel1 TaxID=1679093 RepID=UPI0013EC484D|nr:hypothetical protein [Natronolimnobius sp. AArcel1]NGM70153.1 hypothetical protein [Natronolimnobius sp. AArcel1]